MSYRRITLVTNPDSCNLKCPLCFLNQRQKPLGLGTMDFSLVEKTIRSFYSKDLKEIIPSTMGEPLLYPYFKNLLNLCSQLSIKINLTTNGTFPLGGVSCWAEPLLTHCSDIKISMMGLSASVNEYLMCGINQKEYLENIKLLVEEKKKLQTTNRAFLLFLYKSQSVKRIGENCLIFLNLLKKSVLIELSGTKLFFYLEQRTLSKMNINWMKRGAFLKNGNKWLVLYKEKQK